MRQSPRHILRIRAGTVRTIHHIHSRAAMEDQFGNFVVVEVQLVTHGLIKIVLLGEVHIEIAVICMVCVRTLSTMRIAIVVHYHGHSHSHTSIGRAHVVSAGSLGLDWGICVVIACLVPKGCDQGVHNNGILVLGSIGIIQSIPLVTHLFRWSNLLITGILHLASIILYPHVGSGRGILIIILLVGGIGQHGHHRIISGHHDKTLRKIHDQQ